MHWTSIDGLLGQNAPSNERKTIIKKILITILWCSQVGPLRLRIPVARRGAEGGTDIFERGNNRGFRRLSDLNEAIYPEGIDDKVPLANTG